MPKVSAIIITYNRSKLLRAAIASVLNQTFQDFELIVVDDASTDNTAQVVQAFDDKRINYIRHETNKREAGARNTGVQNSKGEYIAFLDDDDEWRPEKLKRQVELLDSSPAVVGGVYTGFLRIDQTTGKTIAQRVPSKRGNIFHDMFIENWVGTPSTVLVRRQCFDKVGLFDEGIVFGPDYDMWLRISEKFQFEYIIDPLVNYYVHDDKLSTNYGLSIRGAEAIIGKYERFFALNRKNHSAQYYSLGVQYCLVGKTKTGRGFFLKAIRLYPLDIRYYFRLTLSLFGSKNFKRGHEFRERLANWAKTGRVADISQ